MLKGVVWCCLSARRRKDRASGSTASLVRPCMSELGGLGVMASPYHEGPEARRPGSEASAE